MPILPHMLNSRSASNDAYTHIPTFVLKQLGEVKGIPYLNQIGGVSLLILETFQTVKSNKDQCKLMVAQIDEILYKILGLLVAAPEMPHGEVLGSFAKFAETLQKVDAFMRTQQAAGKFKRFLRQQEHSTQLEDSIPRQQMHLVVSNSSTLDVIKDDSARQHEEIINLLSTLELDSISIDDSTEIQKHSILSRLTNSLLMFDVTGKSSSSLSLELLPRAPQIFHGREHELTELTMILLRDSPRVVLLGSGGIGKTSLAKAALHHHKILEKFESRYFVSCESSFVLGDLQAVIATSVGLDLSRNLSKAIIKFLSGKGPSLLILDNFETPWEPAHNRNQVESFLALLADIPQVTMRGLERPHNVRWTRPFIGPLQPIDDDAAQRILSDISDITEDPDMAELLALTGNVPLAITLIASVASVEGCKGTLSRWAAEHTSLLSEGHSRESNLELSLRVSLSSPRMKSEPGALELLAVLSVLPDGASDGLLMHTSSDFLRLKTTLLRTALAYNGADGRLKCLSPVRQFVKKVHGPTAAMAHTLSLYWDEPLRLWAEYKVPPSGILADLILELGNITSLLEWEFRNTTACQQLEEIGYCIVRLDDFIQSTLGSDGLLRHIFAEIANKLNHPRLLGLLMIWRLQGRFGPALPISEAPNFISRGIDLLEKAGRNKLQGSYYFRRGDNVKAVIYWEGAQEMAFKIKDNRGLHRTTCHLAMCKLTTGDYAQAQLLARHAHRIATMAGSFRMEIDAMQQELKASIALGNFHQGIELCTQIKRLTAAASLTDMVDQTVLLDTEADIYLKQTYYLISKSLQQQLVSATSTNKSPLFYANSVANILSLDIQLGTIKREQEVQDILAKTRDIFSSGGYHRGLPMCDRILADFFVHIGRKAEARQIYEKCVWLEEASAVVKAAALAPLGDLRLGLGDVDSTVNWAMTYFAFAHRIQSPLWISWALRLLADLCWFWAERNTAIALFHVALDEFARMNVPRVICRAEGKKVEAENMIEEAGSLFQMSGLNWREPETSDRLRERLPFHSVRRVELPVGVYMFH
ncbi:hypothetical protein C8R43DRAFT_1107769 [Mycena crocata]|nr:hypothetical protein C8R43DRAFT_1107769 [Mycena crocata]